MDSQQSLLLVGRTGNGKSSSGNTILDKLVFKPRSPTVASNDDDVIKIDEAVVDGVNIQVVDGTGIGDTEVDSKKGVTSVMDEISALIASLILSFTAIVLVLRYGVRFTKQEKDAVELVKSIFGQDVLKKWGVILMTCGDNFELDNEDENGTFEDWFKEQTGDIQTLIAECDNRCVLFNNKEKDQMKRRAMRYNLMGKVKAIKNKPYTKDDYARAEDGRKRLVFKEQVPKYQRQTNELVRRVNEQLREIDTRMQWRPDECKTELLELLRQLRRLKNFLENFTHWTDLLKSSLTEISVTELNVQSKISQCERYNREPLHDYPISREGDRIIGNTEERLCYELWYNKNFQIFLGISVVVFIIMVIILAASLG